MRRLFAACLLLVAAAADARELRWRGLFVRAHLADDGTLHVSERHAMLFTGNWLGSDRTFRIEPHQTFMLRGIRRGARPLVAGDLDAADEYRLLDGKTLRWRARGASDPPFANTELVYTIDYSLGRVVVPHVFGDGYRLDYDFAFANRPGPIERFTLELTFGRAWRSPPLRRSATLARGESFPLSLDLQHHGPVNPRTMSRVRALGERTKQWLVPAALLLACAGFLLRPTTDAPAPRYPFGGWLVAAGIVGAAASARSDGGEILALFLIAFGGVVFALIGRHRIGLMVIPLLATLLFHFAQRTILPLARVLDAFSLTAVLSLTVAWLGVYLILLGAARRRRA